MRTIRPLLAGTITLAMLGTLTLSGSAQDTADSAAEVTVVGNLVYATASSPDDPTELTLALFHPAASSEDAPMVIDVGGWTVDPQALAERGVSVFMAFYSDRWEEFRSDANPTALRAMAEAAACAVRFARGSEYGSETAPLVLTGFSRQGGLASHVALAGEDFDGVWASTSSPRAARLPSTTARSARPRPASTAWWVSPAPTTPTWATRASAAVTSCCSTSPTCGRCSGARSGCTPSCVCGCSTGDSDSIDPARGLGELRGRARRSRLRRRADRVRWRPRRSARLGDRDRDGPPRPLEATHRRAGGGPRRPGALHPGAPESVLSGQGSGATRMEMTGVPTWPRCAGTRPPTRCRNEMVVTGPHTR